MTRALVFNPPPGWPSPPPGWSPPVGWTPEPSWPQPPAGWQLWIAEGAAEGLAPDRSADAAQGVEIPSGGALAESSESGAAAEARIAFLEAENELLRGQLLASSSDAPIELDDARVLQAAGIYHYHHPLETAAAYREQLDVLEEKIARAIRDGRAVVSSETFAFNNSLAQGAKLSRDLGRLLLRAYNAEADIAIRSLRAGSVSIARRRLEASRAAIAKLGSLMELRIDEGFHVLRLEEVELVSDWLMMKQEEREAARDERARLREERKVQKELEEQRERLNKERSHLLNALETLRGQGRGDEELQRRLGEVDHAIEQNDFRAANIRAGYIYVISNEGAFGAGVVKIGLTRRLEPTERISELSGAAVPFRFDIHALFFSEDAVTLENELHRHFSHRALNRANTRKEFFFATPLEVRDVLLSRVGNILDFVEHAEASEYRQSVGGWDTAATRSRF